MNSPRTSHRLNPETAAPIAAKNILFINSTSKMSGAEFCLLDLMTGLDRSRFQPFLLLPDPGLFMEKAQAAGIETIILPSLLRNFETHRLGLFPRLAASVLRMRRLIRRRNISLVHANSLNLSFTAGLAARSCAVPLVVHVRDSGLSAVIRPWKGRIVRALCDRILAVSRANLGALIEVHRSLAEIATVLHDGINVAAVERIPASPIRSEYGIPDRAPLAAFIGRIEPRKGCHVLVEAAGILGAEFPSLRILIVGSAFDPGDQEYLDGLRRRVGEGGLGKNVLFTGFRADVLGILRTCDLLVHPAVFADPLPRALMEAAVLRRPVIASRVGGIPEILQDGVSCVLVEPGDARALAAAIAGLLRDPAAAARLSRAARECIEERFPIARHIAEISDVYQSLVRPEEETGGLH